ncbi:MAG: hypothetical protein ACLP1D_15315 [Xanthobacteraceae bacterium]
MQLAALFELWPAGIGERYYLAFHDTNVVKQRQHLLAVCLKSLARGGDL